MKKILFGASALLIFAACSNDETVLEKHEGNAIRFGVSAEGNTRAEDVYCSSNLFDSFTVYATAQGKMLIDEELITLNGSTAATNYFWPNSGAKFYAVQGNEAGSFTFNGLKTDADNKELASTVTFNVNATVASQKDLTYAVAEYDKKPGDGKAQLNFRHALSQVVFKAKNTNEKLHVVINSVAVGGVETAGTYTLPTASTEGNVACPDGTFPVDGKKGEWTAKSGKATYTTAQFGTGIVVPGDATVTNLTVGTDADKDSFANAMLLIPNTANKAYDPSAAGTDTDKEGTYFLVDCDIYNIAGESYNEGDEIEIYSGQIRIPVGFNWEEGKCYVYTLVFGKGNGGGTIPGDGPEEPVLVPITFEVSVDQFVEVVGGTIDVVTPAEGSDEETND